MWYTARYETSHLRASADRSRAPSPGGRPALVGCLRSPPLPNCAGASATGQRAPVIAALVGCDDQTVREVIHGFNGIGLAALERGSSRPHTIQQAFEPAQAERLRGLLHQSPRTFGKATSLWTLDLAAEGSVEHGVTAERVRGETIRATLTR